MKYISADRLQQLKVEVVANAAGICANQVFDVLISECKPLSRRTHVTLHKRNTGEKILVRPELVEMVIDGDIVTASKEIAVRESLEEIRELFNKE